MSIGRMLIHRCDISRHEDTKRGNFTKKDASCIYENKRCRFIRKTSTSSEQLGRVKVSTYYVLMLPRSVIVKNGDIVVWKRGEMEQEMKFRVEEPYAPCGKYNRVTINQESEA